MPQPYKTYKLEVEGKCTNPSVQHTNKFPHSFISAPIYSGVIPVNQDKVLGKCPQCSFDAKPTPQSIEIVGDGKFIGYRVLKPKSQNEPTIYAVMLGSNFFISSEGVLSNEVDGKRKEFFRIRELYRLRSQGSYLAVDIDIKDEKGRREIKLAKSLPVATGEGIATQYDKKKTTVKRTDGSLVFAVQQLETYELPYSDSLKDLWGHNVDVVLKISGSFLAQDCKLDIGVTALHITRYAEDGSERNVLEFTNNRFIGTRIVFEDDCLKVGR